MSDQPHNRETRGRTRLRFVEWHYDVDIFRWGVYLLECETDGGDACGSLLLQRKQGLGVSDEDLRLAVLNVVLETFFIYDHSHALLVGTTVKVGPRLGGDHLVSERV